MENDNSRESLCARANLIARKLVSITAPECVWENQDIAATIDDECRRIRLLSRKIMTTPHVEGVMHGK